MELGRSKNLARGQIFQEPLQMLSSGDEDCRTIRTGRQAQTDDTQVTV